MCSYKHTHNSAVHTENDNEVYNVTGGSQDHQFRSYDTRLGRYKSRDPLSKSYPWNSPYAYSENRVIDGLDLEGREYGDYLDNFISKTKDAAINYVSKKTTQIVSNLASAAVHYVENEYEEFKQSLAEGNKEIKLTGKGSVPLGLFAEEKFEVATQGEGVKLDILSTDLFSIEVGAKLTKDGISPVVDID